MSNIGTLLCAFYTPVHWAGTSSAQITTVILSEDASPDFVISSKEKPKTLEFADATIPQNAIIDDCTLRVVAITDPQVRRPQDVAVLADKKQIGQWSAYGNNYQPYRVELQPE